MSYTGPDRRSTEHEHDRYIIDQQRQTIALLEARIGMRDRRIDELVTKLAQMALETVRL